jgi:TPP-dependent pyruvate/acetoin dehydrogenase alpha subunit
MKQPKNTNQIDFDTFKKRVLDDYKCVYTSRACSNLGRREVLSGKGTFGIFGDGKELPQVAMNHFFKNGDFRSGYYRDQTLLMAQELLNVTSFFHSLYADTEPGKDPMSGGRQMCGHFMTPLVDDQGKWLDQTKRKNHIADLSPTAGQMTRILGLGQASKLYRKLNIKGADTFSNQGNEICWGTIGNASTSEGLFFETVNAAGVLQIPMVLSVYDDGYGISVHNDQQTTKGNISKALEGFQRNENELGIEIFEVKGWDYAALITTYEQASAIARKEHVPVVVHVTELTQPLGHSTSGSHQRYKSKERLEWEKTFDCNLQFKNWILGQGMVTPEDIASLEKEIDTQIRTTKNEVWNAVNAPIQKKKALCYRF